MLTGEILRQLRSLRGMKQKDVADRLRISQPAYSKLEKRRHINGETLIQIMIIFQCTDLDIEAIQRLLGPH